MNRVPPDRVDFSGDTARFVGALKPRVLRFALSFLQRVRRHRYRSILFDFRRCTKAYPNTLVPLIATVQALLRSGVNTQCELPRDDTLRSLFVKSNWAHFLAPQRYDPTDTVHDRHLACKCFGHAYEQQELVNLIVDVTMRTLELDRATLGGLEWVVTEITDNVLNHSESPVGGFAQLTTYQESRRIAFCCADGGRGILSSLREGHPELQTDRHAISEAVRAGVTRNKDIGQGNGLSGSLKIATMADGRMGITTGVHTTVWTATDVEQYPANQTMSFPGTSVDIQLSVDSRIDLAEALSFNSRAARVVPTDTIELKYLSNDSRSLKVCMREEESGFGSRHAGLQMRTKCKNLMRAELDCVLVIDWEGVQMVSSSFADEFVGKLFVELGPMLFMSRVRQINAVKVIQELIDRAILQRMNQEAGTD